MKKGFTLIELLIVIGIIAVLATAVLLVLNPAQILAETRDTQRFSDLDTLKNALALYATTVSPVVIPFVVNTCTDQSAPTYWTSVAGSASPFVATTPARVESSNHSRSTAGTGWVPVQLDNVSGGSPLSTLPQDPTGTTTYYYSFACNNTNKTFELDANLESTKYTAGATNKEINTADGGDNDLYYEIGTKLTL